MEFRAMILGHFLVVSLALNAGLLYRGYCNVKQKSQDVFSFNNECKNSSLITKREAHVAKRAFLETKAKFSEVIDLDQKIVELNEYNSALAHWWDSLTCAWGFALCQLRDRDKSCWLWNSHGLTGDPTMYERYWQQMGDKTTVVIPGWKFISYFSDFKSLCWFLEPEFASSVIRLHKLVGNAVTEDRHIVVGTGSTQLFQAVLYAVSPPNASEPISVVSAAPFYSSYPLITDFLKSGLYKWAGDAMKFKTNKPCIELVTSPNNPDGLSREAVVNKNQGILIHDLAYYWPQYTSIASSPADYDIMLFTVSKSTGHAGTRLGWALVKDKEIAKKMTEFIVVSSIGVSKESQIRATKILNVLSDSHEERSRFKDVEAFFDHSYNVMAMRWRQLRDAVERSKLFSLPDFPHSKCSFSGRAFASQPAFAWLKCEAEIEDCESFLRDYKIIARSGMHFGGSPKYVRISMLPRDEIFDQFTERLASITAS